MKILWLVNYINQVGGIERVVCGLSNYFVEQNYEVKIVSINSFHDKVFFKISDKVKILPWKVDWKTQTRRKTYYIVQDILKSNEADIVLTCHPDISLSAILNQKYIQGKLIVTQHSASDYYTKKQLLANRFLYRFADKLVLLTQNDQKIYQKSGLKNTIVIPNAIFNSGTEFKSVRKPIILAVGRLEEVKGFDMAIKAFSQIVDKYPEWKLRILGEGTKHEELKTLIESYGLQNQVELAGNSDKVDSEMQEAGIYVLSSRSEGFSLTLIEAMSQGCPILTYELPAALEILGRENGYFVPQNNIDELAVGMGTLMEKEEVRQAYSKKAEKRSRDYNLKNVGRQWDELFKSLL